METLSSITGRMWGESIGYRGIPFTKDYLYGAFMLSQLLTQISR